MLKATHYGMRAYRTMPLDLPVILSAIVAQGGIPEKTILSTPAPLR